MDVPDPDKPETWSFQVMQSWKDETTPPSADLSSNEGRLKFFKTRSEEYAEPWRSVGRAVKDATVIPMDRLTYWEKSKRWDNRGGRMTLCGDAAHPMTPRKFSAFLRYRSSRRPWTPTHHPQILSLIRCILQIAAKA
jgi:2-polyprenyl-6-methoxyphenol hydroxylase-like FAD-dependent oxidoreductase